MYKSIRNRTLPAYLLLPSVILLPSPCPRTASISNLTVDGSCVFPVSDLNFRFLLCFFFPYNYKIIMEVEKFSIKICSLAE